MLNIQILVPKTKGILCRAALARLRILNNNVYNKKTKNDERIENYRVRQIVLGRTTLYTTSRTPLSDVKKKIVRRVIYRHARVHVSTALPCDPRHTSGYILIHGSPRRRAK